MIRVRDPRASLAFYQDVMGMKLMTTIEIPAGGFNLYFLGYPGKLGLPPSETATNINLLLKREGLLELTWNYGTEKLEGFSYHDGNKEPQGFGHICEYFRLLKLNLYLDYGRFEQVMNIFFVRSFSLCTAFRR